MKHFMQAAKNSTYWPHPEWLCSLVVLSRKKQYQDKNHFDIADTLVREDLKLLQRFRWHLL
jgi:hypothetical protein